MTLFSAFPAFIVLMAGLQAHGVRTLLKFNLCHGIELHE
jgi:hypothetical protein